MQPVAPRAAADRVVAGAAPDDRAAVAGDDRVVVRAAEDPVEPEATVDAVVPPAGVDDVTAATGADLVVARERQHEVAVVGSDQHVGVPRAADDVEPPCIRHAGDRETQQCGETQNDELACHAYPSSRLSRMTVSGPD